MTSGNVQTLHFLLPSGGLSVAKPNAIGSSSPAFNTHFGVCATLAACWVWGAAQAVGLEHVCSHGTDMSS
jgi:hypothetical protein